MKYNLFISLFLVIIIGCSSKKDNVIANIIKVSPDQSITVEPLSRCASSIEYIPLETNESVLIGETEILKIGKEAILVKGALGAILLFDRSGAYLNKIGEIGQGPGEYLFAIDAGFVPDKEQIYIRTIPRKWLIYNFNGVLDTTIYGPELPFGDATGMLVSGNTPIRQAHSGENQDKHDNWISIVDSTGNVLKNFLLGTKYLNFPSNSWEPRMCDGMPFMYQYMDDIRFYQPLGDTLFTITPDLNCEPVYVFDFGKNKGPLDKNERAKATKYIKYTSINESSDYLFIDFYFGDQSPEAFQYTYRHPYRGITAVVTNHMVMGLYDKNKHKLCLLKQPIPKMLGLADDIQGGPPFWPKNMSAYNEMVGVITAGAFLESYEKLESPSKKLQKMAQTLKEDDNPIIMIAKLKKSL